MNIFNSKYGAFKSELRPLKTEIAFTSKDKSNLSLLYLHPNAWSELKSLISVLPLGASCK